tara:strand:- start:1617 stop:1826 length:210 start_codon:yes stop_codon:yes gene_type:complete
MRDTPKLELAQRDEYLEDKERQDDYLKGLREIAGDYREPSRIQLPPSLKLLTDDYESRQIAHEFGGDAA